jgi:hypothetical protein
LLSDKIFRPYIAAAGEKAIRVIEKLRGLRLARLPSWWKPAVEETLAYSAWITGGRFAQTTRSSAFR